MAKKNLGVVRMRYADMIHKQKVKINKLKAKVQAEEYLMSELEREKKLLK